VAGGGFTGLAAAHALVSSGRPFGVTLLESSDRLGGKAETHYESGFVLDAGPDSWLAVRPGPVDLARKVGLERELIGTIEKNRRVYVAWRDALHPLPEGLVLGVPTRFLPMVKTRLFPWSAKLRMGLEPLVPRRPLEGDDDETIADFATRRLGREATERLVGPMLGGIFGGDARTLSARAAVPQLVEAERAHGSLVRAMRASRRAPHAGGRDSAFLSLHRGMGAFVEAIAASLQDALVRTGARVERVEPRDPADGRGQWTIVLDTKEALVSDDLVLALPAFAAASIVRGFDVELATLLDGIPYASSAAVFLAFRRASVAHPLDASGYIVPRVLASEAVAVTWISSKWEGRAPDGTTLMRVFFGGAGREAILANDDETLVRVAREELCARIGLEGEPVFTRVFRFNRASPQPLLGHIARMRKIRERVARWPGLYVGGGGYEGIGIPSCIEQGRAIAREMIG